MYTHNYVYVSSASLKRKYISESVYEIADSGIRNVELSGGTDYTDSSLQQLLELKEKYSLNYMVHNYFPPPQKHFVLNIASSVKETRQKSVDFCKNSIAIAAKLGVDRYTVHAGYAEELMPPSDSGAYFEKSDSSSVSYEDSVNYMCESVVELIDYSDNMNILFGLENLFPYGSKPKQPILSTPETIFEYLERFRETNAGILLDLGHLLISANYYGFDKDAFIKRLTNVYRSKIIGIHISGNDGKYDSHCPLEEHDWQLKGLRMFEGVKVPVTLEARNLSSYQIIDQVNLVKENLQGL